MLGKICFSAMASVCLLQASAQDSTKAPDPVKTTTITGSVDVYYRFNFANAKSSLQASFARLSAPVSPGVRRNVA